MILPVLNIWGILVFADGPVLSGFVCINFAPGIYHHAIISSVVSILLSHSLYSGMASFLSMFARELLSSSSSSSSSGGGGGGFLLAIVLMIFEQFPLFRFRSISKSIIFSRLLLEMPCRKKFPSRNSKKKRKKENSKKKKRKEKNLHLIFFRNLFIYLFIYFLFPLCIHLKIDFVFTSTLKFLLINS